MFFSGSRWNHFKNGIFDAFWWIHGNVHLLLIYRMFIIHSLILNVEPLLNDFLKRQFNLYVGKV